MKPIGMEVIGVGILALLILKEVFSFLRMYISKNTSSSNGNGKTKIDLHDIKNAVDMLQKDIAEIKTETKDLWIWHDKEDPDQPGVKVWYTGTKKTETAMTKFQNLHYHKIQGLNQ